MLADEHRPRLYIRVIPFLVPLVSVTSCVAVCVPTSHKHTRTSQSGPGIIFVPCLTSNIDRAEKGFSSEVLTQPLQNCTETLPCVCHVIYFHSVDFVYDHSDSYGFFSDCCGRINRFVHLCEKRI